MASSSNNGSVGKWEVVKKNKKQNSSGKSQADKKCGGGGRKALSESNLPRVEQYPAVKMSETIFETFEKIGKKQNKEQVPPPAETQQKKSNGAKQSKKSPSSGSFKPTHYKTLEEAVKALDVGELRQQLEKSQTLFLDNPSVWVKDLAGYLNSKLLAPDTDPTLSTYAHDYPYCLAGKELRSVIKNLLVRSASALEDSFNYCVFTILRDLDKHPGEPLHGYRMCIQAIMMTKPKIATQNLSEHLELLRSHQNRPAKCLSIMWALGQAGFCDLSQGIKVWLGIMLPVLGMKSLSAYAISYLDRLLMLHANLTKGFGVMGPKEFFPLLDFAYMPRNSLSTSLQEQLRRLYPRLKVLAFGAKPESTLHTYFPSFLSRATPSCPDAMKRELLNSLTECLSVDVQSLGVWRQLYTKHLTQSSLFLSHLLASWSTLSPKLRNNLQETIQSFRVTNEEMKTTGNIEDVKECNAVCKSLQTKIRAQGFPWSRLLMALLVLAAGFIAHDVRSRGTFSASTTALYLEKTGAPAVSQQAWRTLSHYSQQGTSWLAEKTPYYYSLAVEAFGPTLDGALEKLKVVAVIIAQRSSEIIFWLAEKTPYYYSLAVEAFGPTLEGALEKLKVVAVIIAQRSSEIIVWLAEKTPYYYSLAVEAFGPTLDGALEKLKVVAVIIAQRSSEIIFWLAEKTPYYYSLAVEAFGPTLEGALEKLKVVAVIIAQRSSEIIVWLAEKTPYYYSLAVEAFGPTLEGALEKLKVGAVIIAQRSSEIIVWVQEKTPLLIEWISANTPESVFQFLEFVKELLVWAHQNYVLPTVQYLLTGLQQSWQTLLDSCNGEVSLLCLQNHMVALSNSTWMYLQDTTSAIRSWTQELLSRT
ncbi:transmembrane protein 214 isoform X3 [Brachyhypopomus gauderio]|uniref:transmembrane protein 214 isoform X3 n=1 Tax=Brachyhypopomus gauderio TaxID=698409 RepID=UPI0040423F07